MLCRCARRTGDGGTTKPSNFSRTINSKARAISSAVLASNSWIVTPRERPVTWSVHGCPDHVAGEFHAAIPVLGPNAHLVVRRKPAAVAPAEHLARRSSVIARSFARKRQ